MAAWLAAPAEPRSTATPSSARPRAGPSPHRPFTAQEHPPTMSRFDPAGVTVFRYRSYSHDAATGALRLRYELDGGAPEPIEFCEEIDLPSAGTGATDPGAAEVAGRLARLLFLAAGLSYYKAAAPGRIEIVPAVTRQEVRFLEELIRHGLTEFAYV